MNSLRISFCMCVVCVVLGFCVKCDVKDFIASEYA